MSEEKPLIWPGSQMELGQTVIDHIRARRTGSVRSALKYALNLDENVYPRVPRMSEDPLLSVFRCGVCNGNARIVIMLLNKGANVNYTGKGERSPLMEAACTSIAMMRLLISHGADVNYADAYGETALHLAARWRNAVQILVKNGARVARENYAQRTPLDVAQSFLNYQAYDYLLPRTRDAVVLAFALDVAVAFAPLRLPPYVVLEILDWLKVRAGRRAFWATDVAEIKKVTVLVGVQQTQNRLLAQRVDKRAKFE